MANVFPVLVQAGLAVLAFMAFLWLVHIPLRNAALVDLGWALSLPLLALFYHAVMENHYLYQKVFLIMVSIWGVRLALYLFFARIYRTPEEGRYVALRQKWKQNIPLKFFLFFETQALLDLWLSLPFLLVMASDQRELLAIQIMALVLFAVGFIGETVADLQLYFFKKRPENQGKICTTGLWRYSRHPNYFFEILVWWSYALYAISAPFGYLAILAPITIMYFILRITGIPANEEQNMRSKGAQYLLYQQRTNKLIPWFPKKIA
ncbi:MAG: DUF1295 domain-containing protein [Leptospiraceae bacterium]|nr:DUF1295 domain-containing protein [Leptospiraceae bacterium]MDW8306969.1 DUF1295 domain-containing protein [Leptospiraceae bacterium]